MPREQPQKQPQLPLQEQKIRCKRTRAFTCLVLFISLLAIPTLCSVLETEEYSDIVKCADVFCFYSFNLFHYGSRFCFVLPLQVLHHANFTCATSSVGVSA